MGLCIEASAPHTEVPESIACYHFQYDASGPLVPEDSPTRKALDNDQSPNVVFSSYRFTAFCNQTDRYAGKPYSAAAGLYYDYQRWYDQSIGRFISRDPLAGRLSDPQSLNPYAYVENTPTTVTDPSGMGDYGPCTLTGGWASCLQDATYPVFQWYSGLSPEEQQGINLTLAVVLTAATGGAAAPTLLIAGGIGFGLGAGAYLAYNYATGGNPTWAGTLAWGTAGFLTATAAYGIGGRILEAAGIRLSTEVGSTFVEGTVGKFELESDLTAFQYENGASWSSRFVTPTECASAAEARAGLSLPPWNSASFVRQVTIPRGTTVWMGEVAPRFGLTGGGVQIWIHNIGRVIPGPWTPLIPA